MGDERKALCGGPSCTLVGCYPLTDATFFFQVKGVRTDPHSPPRWRVDGTVRNVPEFAKAFNCSVNAKVGPDSVYVLCNLLKSSFRKAQPAQRGTLPSVVMRRELRI
jgi:hypothetical protein